MRKALLLSIIILSLIITPLAVGCSPPDQPPPRVTITYTADFRGETPQGYLDLIVYVVFKNEGYKVFKPSPPSILVEVNGYSYKARESQLETVELHDGAEIQGVLQYHVPPEAATPRVGFSMKYSGQDPYNITWIKSSGAQETIIEQLKPEPLIKIAYSTELMWLAATPEGINYLEVEPNGNLYLVVEMTVENKGYESFSINPDYFSLEASSVIRSVVSRVQGELIDWRELNIQNMGKYTGSLIFHVPTEVAQSFYRWDYKMLYSGVRSYNIEWTKLTVSKCTIEPFTTDLEAKYLNNNENIQGTLAFMIAPQFTSEDAIFEVLYAREKSPHNVQFFNKPNTAYDVNRNPIAYPVIKVTYSTNVERQENTGRLYLIVDVLIENKGYETFYTAPANFYLEVTYKSP